MRWRRGDGIPDDEKAALDLGPRERVLAAAREDAGGWLAATEQALVGRDLRLAWSDVGHAQWLDEERTLVVDLVAPGATGLRARLSDPRRLPEAVHERVMASIVVSRRVAVPGVGELRVVGRDDGGRDLVWQVVPDQGVDGSDPDVRRVAAAAVTQLRGELGR
ncbi:MAG TPA: hypothetical protein VF423_12575 [Actinomycetes bacterium]